METLQSVLQNRLKEHAKQETSMYTLNIHIHIEICIYVHVYHYVRAKSRTI